MRSYRNLIKRKLWYKNMIKIQIKLIKIKKLYNQDVNRHIKKENIVKKIFLDDYIYSLL